MFVVVQIPIVDLRSLVGGMGRLPVPDWRSDDPGECFVRGFGQMAIRNSDSFGLLGERAFADFNQATKFPPGASYTEDDWAFSPSVQLRFRRLYFDGDISGRFEFGFITDDLLDGVDPDSTAPPTVNPKLVAATVQSFPLKVRNLYGPDEDTTVGECGSALAMAYLAATTRHSALNEFPIADTYKKYIKVGNPIIHIRISSELCLKSIRDIRRIDWEKGHLYITSAEGEARLSNVLVQESQSESTDETPTERATRVLFSHLNSFIFALNHLTSLEDDLERRDRKAAALDLTNRLQERLASFSPTGPIAEGDDDFSAALRGFGATYKGRTEELTARLKELGDELAKPSSARRGLDYLRGLFELTLTTAVKTSVEVVMKG